MKKEAKFKDGERVMTPKGPGRVFASVDGYYWVDMDRDHDQAMFKEGQLKETSIPAPTRFED